MTETFLNKPGTFRYNLKVTNCICICWGCGEEGKERGDKGYIFISLERKTKEISTEILISKRKRSLRICLCYVVKHHLWYKLNK